MVSILYECHFSFSLSVQSWCLIFCLTIHVITKNLLFWLRELNSWNVPRYFCEFVKHSCIPYRALWGAKYTRILVFSRIKSSKHPRHRHLANANSPEHGIQIFIYRWYHMCTWPPEATVGIQECCCWVSFSFKHRIAHNSAMSC